MPRCSCVACCIASLTYYTFFYSLSRIILKFTFKNSLLTLHQKGKEVMKIERGEEAEEREDFKGYPIISSYSSIQQKTMHGRAVPYVQYCIITKILGSSSPFLLFPVYIMCLHTCG